MSKYSALVKRASNATAALALTVASLTPAIMLGGTAKAGQMTERKITMSNSKAGQSGVTYTVSFKAASAATIKTIVVDFCSNSPIIGASCTAPTGFAITGNTAQTIGGNSFAVTEPISDQAAMLRNATGAALSVGDTVSFDLVVTNPTDVGTPDVGTFYARVMTYTVDNNTYTDSTAPGSYTDAGGIALSTTTDVTINARVQETLEFCVGADADASATTTCADIDGSIVDLGVLDTGTLTETPLSNVAARDGNAKEGKILVSTNAFNGVKIYYYSANSLKTSGVVDCNSGDTSTVNQCFNATDTNGATLSAGTEGFGMKLIEATSHTNVSGEYPLGAVAPYNGSNYTWTTDAADEIASTSGVVANDGITLKFAATPSLTTPSGYYTTSANFIAVASF